jgi:hypothetical protein
MHPGKDVHVADLLIAGGNPETERDPAVRDATIVQRVSPGESSDALLDSAARAAYRKRLAELQEDLADAERSNDLGRATKTRQELDFIAAELGAAYGLGGRARKTAANPLERARKAIGFRIRQSLVRIEHAHPALGRHLRSSLKTGAFCSYSPDAVPDWDVAF